MRLIWTLALLGIAFVLAGTALAASDSQVVVKVRTTSLGKILVATNGKTLYMFAKDTPSESYCNGNCAKFWPPLITSGKPTAGPGVKKEVAEEKEGPQKVVVTNPQVKDVVATQRYPCQIRSQRHIKV